ncbi:solute carrier family 35 member C2-like isoform X1 [Montipora foliosa]|uniref:solute carrier family 35 member C2-like isoform X1 n=2 Tax=Montipora foliosa TaxID=591990 RepID=UPI0035F1D825
MARKQFGFQQLRNALETLGYILFMYVFSISLTFYNRWFLQRFHFPLSVSVVHCALVFVVLALLRLLWEMKTEKQRIILPWSVYLKRVLPTAIACALDIGCSNWSLMYIKVSLYTMTKSTSVIFILMFAIAFGLEQWNFSLIAIILLIASGLFLFTFESTEFNAEGFFLALFASGLSGLRWTLTQILIQKQELGLQNPLDTLYHLQPFMTLTLIPFTFYIEGQRLAVSPKLFRAPDSHTIWVTVSMVLFGGFLALMINVSEFLLLSHTSSLALSISGIFKEICIVSLATEFAGDKMTTVNFFGLVLCLIGISVHVVTKATKDADRDAEIKDMTNGGVELMELLTENTAPSDFEDEEFELNVYGKR